jgi:acetyltransferase-like isoleucine patch superfamily enzyme
MLPFKQAIKFPIFLYGKVYIKESSGRIIFDNDVSRGMIRVGYVGWHHLLGSHYIDYTTILKIEGILKVSGPVEIGNGSAIAVLPHGTLSLGGGIATGPHVWILCETNIKIGPNTRMSWQVQIFDTNFHFLYDESGMVHRRSKPIEIGSHVWIGNRVTINKGAVIPDYCIVASNSLVNKNFSSYSKGMLAGSPAKHIAVNRFRVFSFSDEFTIQNYFLAHPEASEYHYGIPEYHDL